MKTTDQLVRLAMAGASLEVSRKSTSDLLRIAQSLRPGATLRILDASAKSTDQLLNIALAKPGQVIIVAEG